MTAQWVKSWEALRPVIGVCWASGAATLALCLLGAQFICWMTGWSHPVVVTASSLFPHCDEMPSQWEARHHNKGYHPCLLQGHWGTERLSRPELTWWGIHEELFWLLTPEVKVLLAQSCPTFGDPMDCSPAGSSGPQNSPGTHTGVGCHFLCQEIFPTQGPNPGLPRCKQILTLPVLSVKETQSQGVFGAVKGGVSSGEEMNHGVEFDLLLCATDFWALLLLGFICFICFRAAVRRPGSPGGGRAGTPAEDLGRASSATWADRWSSSAPSASADPQFLPRPLLQATVLGSRGYLHESC